MLAVMAAGGCLVPESDAPELDLFAGVGPDRKKKKRKRHVRNEQEMKGVRDDYNNQSTPTIV
jgi:hypothetical protein